MNQWDLSVDEKNAELFLQKYGIFQNVRVCNKDHKMTISFGQEFRWKCDQCSYRNSCVSYVAVVRFIYAWSHEQTSIKWCKRELGITKNVTIDCKNFMQHVCVETMIKKENKKILFLQ
ncbi:hypothetical protein MXB_313 [Myxobolus squamalis]|nr:hypothetical protein MXB_313 [Myxobolus squamalis]